jgi:GTP-binding protein
LRGVKGSDPIFASPIPQIAFVGRSNVGKSSTINALLGVSGLARTSQTPGKTQEINFFSVGDSVYFVDLPGYGYAKMPEKDAEAIRKHIVWYLSGGEARPRLLVLIVDGRHELSAYDNELLTLAKEEGHPLLVLLNKVDTLNQKERAAMRKYYDAALFDVPFVPFSAKTKEGVDDVRAILFSR